MVSGESCLNNYDAPYLYILPKSKIRQLEGSHMEEVSKTISEMQQGIASKESTVYFHGRWENEFAS